MSTVSRRTLVRATAVTACAGSLLALPAAAALAEGVPAASSAHSAGPQRTLVKTLSLADGVSTARIYHLAGTAYQADILDAEGRTAATLTSRDGITGIGGTGELHAALGPEGRLTSWVGDAPAPGAGHAVSGDGYKTGTRSGRVVPASAPLDGKGSGGAVGGGGSVDALRLDTLADGPGDGVLLLAAGAGIAAVGAAGLGFAMLRRGRTES
ncbi:hypothetical protein [Streptomyces subrutilus]|uniref:Uncharacterized protein n=1 Tax=Streptomyces subrutilus TaxID=36818 RepID=A0A5P2UMM8_9ACTN|nr:hypothetical protein [Streptomyces subrutilus]QEU78794.1 hypothetical protein CP968_11255 [Streptomyces subrutilus]WSJ32020.1 hypothetical protein OG479_23605 [Streptomyces subrutilus]GGZ57636.1 hypothetical protein GCM10010371_16320 [Streptomyces subrutilus]